MYTQQSWAVLQVHGYWNTCISSTSVFQIPVFPVLPVLFFECLKKRLNVQMEHLWKKIVCIFLRNSACLQNSAFTAKMKNSVILFGLFTFYSAVIQTLVILCWYKKCLQWACIVDFYVILSRLQISTFSCIFLTRKFSQK